MWLQPPSLLPSSPLPCPSVDQRTTYAPLTLVPFSTQTTIVAEGFKGRVLQVWAAESRQPRSHGGRGAGRGLFPEVADRIAGEFELPPLVSIPLLRLVCSSTYLFYVCLLRPSCASLFTRASCGASITRVCAVS